ncbi:hypothetical protein JXB01_03415 [Candidatus Micrarchaeota archaeon]|nr:hypothetical protein [Candidatus Micrarchaeota archaeon]
MKTMRSSFDLKKEDILWILKRAREVEGGEGKSLEGKILGVLTYRPSLRTTAALEHSMLKAKGDYIVLDASYLKAGEEDLEDTVRAVADLVDMLALRTPMTVDIKKLKSSLPIINCMCGDEHTIGALWFFYSLMKRGKELEGMKIGAYGQVRYSQPTIALYRVGAKLGMHFYEDSVVDEIGAVEELQKQVIASGGSWERKPRNDFIKEVDMMWISEGRPGEGADKSVLESYMNNYQVVTPEIFNQAGENCFWYCDEPRALPDGRLSMVKELDTHPKLLNEAMMKESIFVTRAVFEWIFG